MGATNRPDCVDVALLRPGRFDRLLFVPPPDAAARRAILGVHMRDTPLDPDVSLEVMLLIALDYRCTYAASYIHSSLSFLDD